MIIFKNNKDSKITVAVTSANRIYELINNVTYWQYGTDRPKKLLELELFDIYLQPRAQESLMRTQESVIFRA